MKNVMNKISENELNMLKELLVLADEHSDKWAEKFPKENGAFPLPPESDEIGKDTLRNTVFYKAVEDTDGNFKHIKVKGDKLFIDNEEYNTIGDVKDGAICIPIEYHFTARHVLMSVLDGKLCVTEGKPVKAEWYCMMKDLDLPKVPESAAGLSVWWDTVFEYILKFMYDDINMRLVREEPNWIKVDVELIMKQTKQNSLEYWRRLQELFGPAFEVAGLPTPADVARAKIASGALY